jgi:hypothetical protein
LYHNGYGSLLLLLFTAEVMAVFAFEVKVYTVALLCANVLAPVSGLTQGKTESKLVLAEGLATHCPMATHVSPITLYTQHIILSDNFLSCHPQGCCCCGGVYEHITAEGSEM